MQVNVLPWFFTSIIAYVIILNVALILIVEPKFLVKYYAQNPLYLKIKEPAAAVTLILLFVSSFYLGMMTLILKLFNQLLIF